MYNLVYNGSDYGTSSNGFGGSLKEAAQQHTNKRNKRNKKPCRPTRSQRQHNSTPKQEQEQEDLPSHWPPRPGTVRGVWYLTDPFNKGLMGVKPSSLSLKFSARTPHGGASYAWQA